MEAFSQLRLFLPRGFQLVSSWQKLISSWWVLQEECGLTCGPSTSLNLEMKTCWFFWPLHQDHFLCKLTDMRAAPLQKQGHHTDFSPECLLSFGPLGGFASWLECRWMSCLAFVQSFSYSSLVLCFASCVFRHFSMGWFLDDMGQKFFWLLYLSYLPIHKHKEIIEVFVSFILNSYSSHFLTGSVTVDEPCSHWRKYWNYDRASYSLSGLAQPTHHVPFCSPPLSLSFPLW